jgi:hypothetical protein
MGPLSTSIKSVRTRRAEERRPVLARAWYENLFYCPSMTASEDPEIFLAALFYESLKSRKYCDPGAENGKSQAYTKPGKPCAGI